ncbi:MAG: sugar phosphate isomerase/epimerase [Thaumarchaeota archaeon]|nr:sugar phosphate isomerase/epimerase [Nitrososphaerota archaeon]
MLRSSSITFHTYTLEQVCKLNVELGFDALELWKDHLPAVKTPELASQFSSFARDIGLNICALNNVDSKNFKPYDSEESFAQTLMGLKADVDLASLLSIKDVFAFEGRDPRGGNGDKNALLKTISRLFHEAIVYSSKKGIRFLIEPHPFTVGMDLDFLIKLCDSLDSNYFGVLYDCAHFAVAKPDGYIESIRILGKRIKHIHFSDSDKRTSELHYPPGMGKLDIDGILRTFKEIGYSGTITLDLWGYPLPIEGSKMGIKKMEEAINKLGIPN